MPRHDEAEVIRAYCEAWIRGDALAVLAMYHQELTLDWPGRHRLAGIHEGQPAAVDALLDVQAITNRRPVEIVDILVGDHSVIALVRERWTTAPNDSEADSIELVRTLDFTVADGQVRTCRIFEADQPAVDEWISRYGDPVSEG